MTDPEFEVRLGRWFAETPVLPDVDSFARRVERRIDRSWRMRRIFIAVAGLVGGLFAAGQMLGAQLFGHLTQLSGRSVAAATEAAKAVGQLRLLTMLPVGSEVLWVGAGLAFLAVVLLATRALEDF
jgi:hypothetical protein